MQSAGIQRQVQLPLRKALEIALRSLRVRMARSTLTLATIVMAIAFLTNVWMMRRIEGGLASLPAAALQTAGVPAAPAASSPARTVWLLGLSLLVCMVGISNAMLMSVMERFREIGTMKCLGALDSFILKLFFLESLCLGAVGTGAGVLLGWALTAVLAPRNYGSAGWNLLTWSMIMPVAGASAVIGLTITAAAALYPAWKAARMEPIAAMRVDA